MTTSSLQVKSVNIGMMERHPMFGCSLSDLFAIEATISRCLSHEDSALDDDTSPNPLSTDFYDSVLAMISSYMNRELLQRKFRLAHFLLSTGVSIVCLVAIWWSPRNFVSFILMLVSTLSFGVGVIAGLIGCLFVGSELSALKEFKWEILNAKQLAEGKTHTPGWG